MIIGVTNGPSTAPMIGIDAIRKPAIAPKISPKVAFGNSLYSRQTKSMIFPRDIQIFPSYHLPTAFF